jgi:hypothetical protein
LIGITLGSSTPTNALCLPRKSIAGRPQPKPLPRFAAIETLQREQNLTSLAPKRGFIAAQPVKGTGWQVGQANKGPCEIVGWIGWLNGRWGASINSAAGFVAIRVHVRFGRERSVRAVDDLRALSMGLPTLAKLKQMFRLDLEQTALDGGGATQPP